MWDLVPWPGIEPGPPALGAQSLSHWPSKEVPLHLFFFSCLLWSIISIFLSWIGCFFLLLAQVCCWTPLLGIAVLGEMRSSSLDNALAMSTSCGPLCQDLLTVLPLCIPGCRLVPPLLLPEAAHPPGTDTQLDSIQWRGGEGDLTSWVKLAMGVSKQQALYRKVLAHLVERHLWSLHFLAFLPHPHTQHTYIKFRHRLRFGDTSL